MTQMLRTTNQHVEHAPSAERVPTLINRSNALYSLKRYSESRDDALRALEVGCLNKFVASRAYSYVIDLKRKEWGLRSRGDVLEHLLGWIVETTEADE